jgi:hypothetical protein
MSGILLQGLVTILGIVLLVLIVVWFVQDVTQKKHTILRNFPVVGRLRYVFERQGEYFRQYFFANDREEMPFNRSVRSWVYRLAKDEGGTIGFGSTNNISEPGNIIFVNAAFPVLEEERAPTPPLIIGAGYCREPFEAKSIVNVSGMSFGAISEPAVRALSRGAKTAGCWMDTGEGGLSPYHIEGGCDVIMQIGTANYGVRDAEGRLDLDKVKALAPKVKAFEIKLSQGAKPGKGGVLPAAKVTEEIAAIRGIPVHEDSISPNRHRDLANMSQLLERVRLLREISGRPIGIKTAIGGWEFMRALCETVNRMGLEAAPDFLAIDGGEGGTGAAPQALMDHMALPIAEALPRVVDAHRVGVARSHPGHCRGETRDFREGGMGAVRRRGLREHRARVHVLAGLHPGHALPHEHLSDRCHDAQPAAATRPGGRGEASARCPLRAEHEQGDRHDCALLWAATCTRVPA